MADVVPPPTTPHVTSTSSSSVLPTLTVTDPPLPLIKVPLGTRIIGRVIAPLNQLAVPAPILGQYQIQIQTSLGILAAQSPLSIPSNSALILVLQSLGDKPQLLLTSLNGKLLSLLSSHATPVLNSLASGSKTQTMSSLGSQPITQLTQGATVKATLLRFFPTTSRGTALPSLSPVLSRQLAASSVSTSTASTSAPPASSIFSGTQNGVVSSKTPLTSNSEKVASAGAPLQSSRLPAGTQATVKIISLKPSAPGASVAPPLATGSLLSGQVLSSVVSGLTPQGHPVISTHTGTFSLATPTVLPTGTQVTFEIVGNLLLPPNPKTSPGQMLTSLHDTKTWPELTEALQTLTDVNPAVAQQVVNSIIPRADALLTTNIIFFLAALRGGELRSWLGDRPTNILQYTKPDLVVRLGDSFRQRTRVSEEAAAGEWRSTPVPFLNGAEIEQIFLYTQRHNQDKNLSKGKADTRFVVDITLTSLGRLQLDGLLHQGRKHFDLIFRSENPLPGKIPEDVRNIFINAAEVTGMQGGISFQASPPNFVEILPPIDSENDFGVTV